MSRSRAPGRRRFLRAVGYAGLSSALVPSAVAFAQLATPPAGGAEPAKPDTTKTPEKPPEPSEDARALAGIIRRRYGEHLSAEQLEGVTRELDNRIQGGKRLRSSKLANADEPDFVFRA